MLLIKSVLQKEVLEESILGVKCIQSVLSNSPKKVWKKTDKGLKVDNFTREKE